MIIYQPDLNQLRFLTKSPDADKLVALHCSHIQSTSAYPGIQGISKSVRVRINRSKMHQI